MRKYSGEEKEMWLEDWGKSGKSTWSYAKANGISPATFKNWVVQGKSPEQAPAPRFVEVKAETSERAAIGPEILIKKGMSKSACPWE
jgi:transposase-like protein